LSTSGMIAAALTSTQRTHVLSMRELRSAGSAHEKSPRAARGVVLLLLLLLRLPSLLVLVSFPPPPPHRRARRPSPDPVRRSLYLPGCASPYRTRVQRTLSSSHRQIIRRITHLGFSGHPFDTGLRFWRCPRRPRFG
jgi:hypothetical protein